MNDNQGNNSGNKNNSGKNGSDQGNYDNDASDGYDSGIDDSNSDDFNNDDSNSDDSNSDDSNWDDSGNGEFDQDDLEPHDSEPDSDKENCFYDLTDEKLGYKVFDLFVPVSVKPFAVTDKPEVRCLGDLEIYPGSLPCNRKLESFDFTMTQKISVQTPVKYGMKTCYGNLCGEEIEV